MLRIFAFNFSGRLILVGISLVSIPVYVRHIGIASYGIIGIYSSLATLAGIFDVAFSNTISRELARRGGSDSPHKEIGAVFRTLEVFAWAVAAALAGLVIAGAGPLINHWIGAEKYAGQDVIGTVRLMGLLLLLQAPLSFYGGCLYGLHRHGLINTINVSGTAVSAALSIVTVIFIAPTIDAFFVAQLVGRVATTGAMATASYVLLARNAGLASLRVSRKVWNDLWRFAVGMNGISVLSLIAVQADMVILSRLLSATSFGYYTLARTVAQSLVTLAAPAYQSTFPQLSTLVNTRDRHALAGTFHRCCQLLAMILLPTGIVIVIFSGEVLALWTRNTLLAGNASLTLSLLAAGSVVYGLGYMISAVQMANGAVRLMILLGAAYVCLIVPALLILVHFYQQTGAALAWLCVNILALALGAVVTLRRHMPGELTRWVAEDNLLPALAAVLPVVLLKSIFAGPDGSFSAAMSLLVAAPVALASSVLAVPEGRRLTLRGVAGARLLLRRNF